MMLEQFLPPGWGQASYPNESEKKEETSTISPQNITTCNASIETTCSSSDELFTHEEHEVFRTDTLSKDQQVKEVSMNLRSGKVLPENAKINS